MPSVLPSVLPPMPYVLSPCFQFFSLASTSGAISQNTHNCWVPLLHNDHSLAPMPSINPVENPKESNKLMSFFLFLPLTLTHTACRVALSASLPLTYPPSFLSPACPLPTATHCSISQSSLASASSGHHKYSGSGSGSPFPSSPSHVSKRGGSKRKSMFGGGVSPLDNYYYCLYFLFIFHVDYLLML